MSDSAKLCIACVTQVCGEVVLLTSPNMFLVRRAQHLQLVVQTVQFLQFRGVLVASSPTPPDSTLLFTIKLTLHLLTLFFLTPFIQLFHENQASASKPAAFSAAAAATSNSNAKQQQPPAAPPKRVPQPPSTTAAAQQQGGNVNSNGRNVVERTSQIHQAVMDIGLSTAACIDASAELGMYMFEHQGPPADVRQIK